MPVDLSKDIVRLEQQASQVPALSHVCSLGREIIRAAQNSRRNIGKLQDLAHFVSDNLVSIAKRVRGNWDVSPEQLKEHLDILEGILRDVCKVIHNYSTLYITAADRDTDISTLESKLSDAKRSILELPGMTSGLKWGRPRTPVNYSGGLFLNRSRSSINYQLGLAMDRSRTVVNSRHDAGMGIDRPHTALHSLSNVRFGKGLPFDHEESGPLVRQGAPGKVEIISRSTTPGLEVDISVDLLGRSIEFDNRRVGSPELTETPSSWSPFWKSKSIPAPNLTGRIRIIKGPLCCGGFCDIYTGKLSTERGVEYVAMKMLRGFNAEKQARKAKKKFRREIDIWRSIKHPYVLPFYGTCEYDDSRLFMVSPWANGGNALEYVQRYPLTDRVRLLWEAASALEYLHSGKDVPPIVHGDLKADNVLVSSAGNALLSDFGLSRFEEELISKSGSSSASPAEPGGNARFMAPELLVAPKGSSQVCRSSFESDVFAFASLMLQIYTENVPFGELREAQAILKLASGELPIRPVGPIILERGLNDLMWALMTECWQFQPWKRPNMKEVTWRLIWADRKTRAGGEV